MIRDRWVHVALFLVLGPLSLVLCRSCRGALLKFMSMNHGPSR